MTKFTFEELLKKNELLEEENKLLKRDGRDSKKRLDSLQAILDNIPAPIYLKDVEGKYILVNKRYEYLSDVTLEQVKNKTDFDIFPASVAELFRSQDDEVKRQKTPQEFEETVTLVDGQYTFITLKFPVSDIHGDIVAVGGFCTDITERIELETQKENLINDLQKVQLALHEEISERSQIETNLLVAKKDAEAASTAKTEFLANMSHEMRTPLHGILGYSKVGQKNIEKASRTRLAEYFSLIHESGERMQVFLTDLLDLATLETGHARYDIKQHDLNLCIFSILNEVQFKLHEKDIRVKFHGEKPNMAQFDRHKIIQVLHNLIGNAIKFSPLESTITISIEKVTPGGVPFQRIQIKDQGIGIPESELDIIFEKFTQSSKTKNGAGGKGLGLSICRGLLTAHSGKIWAENNSSGGSSFCFVLPVN